MRVGVIGCGAWGKNIARNVKALGALCGVVDPLPAAREAQSQAHGVPGYADLGALLAAGCDAVAIASAAPTHHALAMQAMRAGKDVYIEKPLTLDLAQATELAHVATNHARVLQVGHLLQYHPVFRRLVELVRAGDLGEILTVDARRFGVGAVRSAENVLWDLSPHDVSMVLAILGDQEPLDVIAWGDAHLQPGIADRVQLRLRWANGASAHIAGCWCTPIKEQKLIVVGRKASAVFDDTLPWEQKLCLYPGTLVDQDTRPRAVSVPAQPVVLPQGEPLKAELAHFIDCCQTRAQPISGPQEALRVQRVLSAAAAQLS